jgi:hypothetical protein
LTNEVELGITDVVISPAPVADDQKTTPPEKAAEPAQAAYDEKANAETPEDKPEGEPETPEQVEKRKESRRARQNARKAAELAAAKTEARMLREQLEQSQQKPKQTQDDAAPKREDFEDYADYLEARTAYKAEQVVEAKLKSEREARQGTEQQARQAETQQRQAQDWTKREQAHIKASPRYEETVTPFVEGELQEYSPNAKAAIVESEVGPQLLEYLATHLEDSDRISALSPTRQLVELGKIEAKLTTTPVKRTTNAPEPAGHEPSRGNVTKDIHKMSDEEYWAKRKDRKPRWG